jgi:2-oxoglutarate dehydrogenase E1 component
VSKLSDMAEDTGFMLVIPEIDHIAPAASVKRVVLCSGKVYYDLLAERRDKKLNDVAILRIEQLYPFPERTVGRLLSAYRGAEVVWCQEEPANMGAWSFVDRAIEQALARIDTSAKRPIYVGRRAAASPSTGQAKVHAAEQADLVRRALSLG